MTTTTHSHKPWTNKGGHVSTLELLAERLVIIELGKQGFELFF